MISYRQIYHVFLALLLQQDALSLSFGLKKSVSGSTSSTTQSKQLIVKNLIGKGSYGTVHLCELKDGEHASQVVAKRSWDKQELKEMDTERLRGKDISDKSKNKESRDDKFFKEKAQRCSKYLEVEKHCFQKLQELRSKGKVEMLPWQLPELVGCFPDDEGKEWAVFTIIENSIGSKEVCHDINSAKNSVAISLSDAIDTQWKDIHAYNPELSTHRLSLVQRELGLPDDTTFDEVLDYLFQSMLNAISSVHSANIVHRDIKPQNLLLDPSTKVCYLNDVSTIFKLISYSYLVLSFDRFWFGR